MGGHENDFIIQNTGLVVTTIEIPNVGYTLYGSGRKKIAILTSTGYIYRTIVGSVYNEGFNTETISLDTALNIQADTIEEISYLLQVRFASDEVHINWIAKNKGVANVSILGYTE